MKYTDLVSKKDRQLYIRRQVSSNPRWAVRALRTIYANQTADEQSYGTVTEHNGIGFCSVDAEILTSFAHQIQRGRPLSHKQMAIVFKKMPRYSRQLMEAAESKSIQQSG
jgi:hypothetical protein